MERSAARGMAHGLTGGAIGWGRGRWDGEADRGGLESWRHFGWGTAVPVFDMNNCIAFARYTCSVILTSHGHTGWLAIEAADAMVWTARLGNKTWATVLWGLCTHLAKRTSEPLCKPSLILAPHSTKTSEPLCKPSLILAPHSTKASEPLCKPSLLPVLTHQKTCYVLVQAHVDATPADGRTGCRHRAHACAHKADLAIVATGQLLARPGAAHHPAHVRPSTPAHLTTSASMSSRCGGPGSMKTCTNGDSAASTSTALGECPSCSPLPPSPPPAAAATASATTPLSPAACSRPPAPKDAARDAARADGEGSGCTAASEPSANAMIAHSTSCTSARSHSDGTWPSRLSSARSAPTLLSASRALRPSAASCRTSAAAADRADLSPTAAGAAAGAAVPPLSGLLPVLALSTMSTRMSVSSASSVVRCATVPSHDISRDSKRSAAARTAPAAAAGGSPLLPPLPPPTGSCRSAPIARDAAPARANASADDGRASMVRHMRERMRPAATHRPFAICRPRLAAA
eukprot:357881-Chlamydomonas_euryale.AAC.14